MPKFFSAVITYLQTVNVPFVNYSCLFLQAGSARPLLGPIMWLFVPISYMTLKGKI